jgi:probable HAF family extracellular repeat protein
VVGPLTKGADMTRHYFFVTAFVVAATLTQHPVTAAKPGGARPTVVDLGTLGGGFSDANGINNDPDDIQVVGHSTRPDGFAHGFFWTAATGMIDLGSLGRGSDAADINNHSVIAGGSEDAAGQRWAVAWKLSSGVWTIEKLGPLVGACCGRANGLNNGTGGDPSALAVVGTSTVPSGGSSAVMWRKGTTEWLIEDLGTLPGDLDSYAYGVNDSGTVVGVSISSTEISRAFRWTPSTGMVALPGLGGNTTARAIANNGDITGISSDAAGNSHAVRWRATDGVIEDLGTLGGCCSAGVGISTAGTVVGWSDVTRRGNQRAFQAMPGGRMTELGGPKGQSAARALNDFGTIAGGTGNGPSHATIWKMP